ncbi:DUF1573 domain-containing protein [Alienimonas chondri]|uniref:DUF1573 domain-containing protein n=1 Tax=Alienimonas chondri TaxID=2681879 RepID=A0ABX1VCH6_9PLAN|nr:DUF1573 domain-containing protein [Alienimonas chondri]NNJ25809.1 hypothetical protein [Alienimonas chondri]
MPVATTRDDSWAEALFSEKEHDFGVVARGALTQHPVKIQNTTNQTLHISSIGASCTCASGEVDTQTIAPGETATLTLEMNTRQFYGKKDSNVIVRFDAPRFAEVRIPVRMYCRKDVVLTPGEVNFGAVDKGAGAERTVRIAYAGYAGWQIRGVQGGGKLLNAKVEEVGRTSSGADYELRVKLSPDAPPGPIRERLVLVTSDANNPKVPVLVEGEVEDDITVRDVDLGTLASGQEKRFNVVLRGKKPFKITAMACEGTAGDNFGMKLPDAERVVHVVPMTFTAPDKGGAYSETFTVDVEGRDEPVIFHAKGRVLGG